jgi:hypothetical protein
MWEYILKNKEWIFSGIGVFALTLIATWIFKNKGKEKNSFKKKSQFNDSNFENSPINKIKADNLNFNQTIINSDKEKPKKQFIPIITTPELADAKMSFIEKKSTLRRYIFTVLADRSRKADSVVQIRDVLDYVEELIKVIHTEALRELEEMKDEGILDFALKKDEFSIGPYTRITLTKKFYSTINDDNAE